MAFSLSGHARHRRGRSLHLEGRQNLSPYAAGIHAFKHCGQGLNKLRVAAIQLMVKRKRLIRPGMEFFQLP